MKKLKSPAIVLLSLIFVQLSAAQAIEPTPVQTGGVGIFFTDFCADANAAVCGTLQTNSIGRIFRRGDVKNRVSAQALEHTRRTLGLAPTFQMADLPSRSAWDQIRIPLIYTAKVNELLKLEVSAVEYSALWRQIENVRQYLSAAIDAQLPRLDPNSLALNTALKSELNRTVVLDSQTILNLVNAANPDGKPLLSAYQKYCGSDGFKDNAFAANIAERKYLVVCPGLLIGALGQGRDDQSNFSNMIKVLAHEWGHHFDFRYYPSLYGKYLDCLADYSAELLRDPGALTDNPLDPINRPSATSVRKVLSHAAEITADFWGTQAIVQYFASARVLTTFDQKLNFLRESHGMLCHTPDEGIHPAGDYRMNVLLRTDPAIASTMGCTTRSYPGVKPSCTLQGLYLPKLN